MWNSIACTTQVSFQSCMEAIEADAANAAQDFKESYTKPHSAVQYKHTGPPPQDCFSVLLPQSRSMLFSLTQNDSHMLMRPAM